MPRSISGKWGSHLPNICVQRNQESVRPRTCTHVDVRLKFGGDVRVDSQGRERHQDGPNGMAGEPARDPLQQALSAGHDTLREKHHPRGWEGTQSPGTVVGGCLAPALGAESTAHCKLLRGRSSNCRGSMS